MKLKFRILPVLAIIAMLATVTVAAVSADSWGEGNGEWDISQVQPAYEAVGRGTPVRKADTGEIVPYAVFEAEFAPQGRFTDMHVQGTSMAPFINETDLVFVIWHPLELGIEVGVGDVIGFAQNDSPYGDCRATHRVTSVVGDIGFRTRGDNTYISDRCIVENRNVIYKVVGIADGYFLENE